jgi:hypothetical protein
VVHDATICWTFSLLHSPRGHPVAILVLGQDMTPREEGLLPPRLPVRTAAERCLGVDMNVLVERVVDSLRDRLGPHVHVSIHAASDLGRAAGRSAELEPVVRCLILLAAADVGDSGYLVVETSNVDLEAQLGGKGPEGSYVMVAGTEMRSPRAEASVDRGSSSALSESERLTCLELIYRHIRDHGGSLSLHSEQAGEAALALYLPRSAAG